MKIISVVGARPQFIKVAPILRAIMAYNTENSGCIEHSLVHTGQHYDENMSAVFFEELEIPKPDYNLGIGSASQGAQTGRMLEAMETVLVDEQPDWVLLYGDTNSTLAGALTAAKLHIPVTHVEAGLRSFNRRMPEEINRVLTDHVSTILFCPTETAVNNLKREGFTNIVNDGHLVSDLHPHELRTTHHEPVVLNVGDVMFDSVLYNLKLAEQRSTILDQLHLKLDKPKGYALATVHRAENTDDSRRLRAIFDALSELATKVPVVAPLHPRTQKALSQCFSNSEL